MGQMEEDMAGHVVGIYARLPDGTVTYASSDHAVWKYGEWNVKPDYVSRYTGLGDTIVQAMQQRAIMKGRP